MVRTDLTRSARVCRYAAAASEPPVTADEPDGAARSVTVCRCGIPRPSAWMTWHSLRPRPGLRAAAEPEVAYRRRRSTVAPPGAVRKTPGPSHTASGLRVGPRSVAKVLKRKARRTSAGAQDLGAHPSRPSSDSFPRSLNPRRVSQRACGKGSAYAAGRVQLYAGMRGPLQQGGADPASPVYFALILISSIRA